MKYICILLLSFISISGISQVVHTNTIAGYPIKWLSDKKIYHRDTSINICKSDSPSVIMSYDLIQIIDNDTTTIYLNETPGMKEDAESIDRIWTEVTEPSGKPCRLFLFYYIDMNIYILRILYLDSYNGFEFVLKPFKYQILQNK